jgi:hypothetical protein
LPGDSIQHSTSVLLRCTPLNTPVMHPCSVRVHHWFVPTRIIWANFTNFITGGPDGMDATPRPYVTAGGGGFAVGSLADYLGLPLGVAGLTASALPFRVYASIFNNWYRDQDLTTALVNSTGDGSDTTTSVALQRIAWEKDYFTSSRPWAVKGPAVTLPLGTSAPIIANGQMKFSDATDTGKAMNSVNAGGVGGLLAGTNWTIAGSAVTYNAGLLADLSAATAVDINTFRNALALQRFEEWRARFGSRYTEYLRSLGVRSSDARLQLPEYLGGGKAPIMFSEVLQHAVTTSGTPVTGVGALQGHGISAMRSNRYRRFFEEHGFVMTLLSVRPKTVYHQGVRKLWNRTAKETYWQPQLEHIGQQAVQNQEVDATHGTLTGTFGYQDRYDEYRREESFVTGGFRPGQAYANWTLTRDFGGLPALNNTFVTLTASTRISQDTSQNALLIMCNHSIQARRMLSKTGSSFTY